MTVHIFVPRWMNRSITNAQNSNARSLLTRFTDPRAHWTAVGNDEPPEAIIKNGVKIIHLVRSRLWTYHLALAYQSSFDAIFYAGVDWPDEIGIKLRRLSGRRTPVIATMEGIIAQRLVRKICLNCKTEYTPAEEQLMELELRPEMVAGKRFYFGKGCEQCNNTGYRGRYGLYETMNLDDDMRDMIIQHASTQVLRAEASRTF